MKNALYARAEAFLNEFPFVERYTRLRRFHERPIVQRVDLDLLDKRGHTSASQSLGIGGSVLFFLIGNDGEELAVVQPEDKMRDKGKMFRTRIQGETVLGAIRRMGDPNRIRYILEIKDLFGGDRSEKHDPDYGVSAVVNKVPAGIAFSDWLNQIREIAAEELRTELSRVDQI